MTTAILNDITPHMCEVMCEHYQQQLQRPNLPWHVRALFRQAYAMYDRMWNNYVKPCSMISMENLQSIADNMNKAKPHNPVRLQVEDTRVNLVDANNKVLAWIKKPQPVASVKG